MAGMDSYTKLMLHCDGSDASTSFPDDSDSAHTVTANGDAQVDTAQSVFGGASLLEDGTGDYLSVPDHDDFHFAAADFTVDFRVRFGSTSGQIGFLNQNYSSQSWGLYYQANELHFGWSTNGTSTTTEARAWSPSTDTWYHVALVRYGTVVKMFIGGNQIGTDISIGTDDIFNSTIELYIGANHSGDTTAGAFLTGHMDEIRISKGIARWTSNFTPPTAAYSGTDITVTPDVLNITAAAKAPASVTHYEVVVIGAALAITAAPKAVIAGAFENATILAPVLTLGLSQKTPLVYSPFLVPSAASLGLTLHAPVISIVPTMFASSTLPMMTLSATLTSGALHSFSRTLPMLTLTVRMGTKTSHVLPVLTLSATLSQSNNGSLIKSLPLMTLSATLTVQNSLTFARPLPMFTVNVAFKVGGIHTFARTLPIMTLNAVMIQSAPGTFAATLPLISLSASGYNSDNLTFTKTLPMITLKAFMTSYNQRII